MDQPLQLANRVIRQMVEHSFGADMIVTKDDFMAMRTAFRSLGQSWEKFGDGDLKPIEILSKVVVAWGGMPGRRYRSKEVL